jgi:peptidyl-prolyl cis-trans isomerase A (cyclophilin A)
MKSTQALLVPALAAAFAATAFAQQSTKPADPLPDAPQATAAALVHPNGPTVVMDTSMGRITCQFYQKQAPKAVANFIGLAQGTTDWTDPTTKKKQHNKPYYDGTIFHRVIPEFMIQGGDPTGTGMGDPGFAFDDEFDPNLNFDQPGKLAMANSGPNTNGSQFFITEQAYDSLNQHYTLFGQCDESSVLVVKSIARVQRDGNDKPLSPVVLKKVTIVQEGQQVPPTPEGAKPAPQPAPLPAPGTAKRIQLPVGGPRLVYKERPAYPPEAEAAHISGTVEVQIVIGTDGRVIDANPVSGPKELRESAVAAAKTMRFVPYKRDGQVVEVSQTISTIYMLADDKQPSAEMSNSHD